MKSEEVAAYLKEHPEFFEEYADLLAEIYIPQFLNAPLSEAWGVSVNLAGLEIWFPYALALAFLLIRPEGLFGEKHIDRV